MKKAGFRFVVMVTCFLAIPGLCFAKEPDVFRLGIMTSFTGPYSGVAETQKKGLLLKVDQINKSGGLNMPWGKVKVETIIKDDKMDVDLSVKLFNEMVSQGINALTGTVYNPIAGALNEESKKTGIPYMPACVPAIDSFKKGNPAPGMYSVAFTPWSIGYLTGGSVIKTLGKKKIYFISRPDSWGSVTLDGLKAAAENFGGEIVGVADPPKETTDYGDVIKAAMAVEHDAFVTCRFGGDAINNLKQAYELGLFKKSLVFNTWITNVVGSGVPAKVLEKLYALEYFYYGLDKFEDQELASLAKKYTEAHMKMWNEPPDAYGTIHYIAVDILFQAVEKAQSFETAKIGEVLATSKFSTVKGNVYFRKDHQMVSKYMAFLVRGKEADEKKDKFDLFDVVGYFGGEETLPSLNSLGY